MDDRPSLSAWLALALLTVIYAFNFLDRTLIYILFSQIKAEMTFTDTEMALLGTTSFVLFYTVLGIPFGRLADRVRRRSMIAAGLVVWSVASGLAGMATGFWSLFFCRVMVGVGEATLAPAATSLLADLFPARMRATVQSIYSAGIPVGAAAAFFLGGWLAERVGWRMTFPALGFPGVALAALVYLGAEPARATSATPAAAVGKVDWGDLLWRIRWPVAGYAMMAVAANALSIWVPTYWLVKVHGFSVAGAGQLAGAAMLTAGALATALGGSWADAWERRWRGGRMRATAVLALACVPAWTGLLAAGSWEVAAACYTLLAGLGLAWLGPAAADVQDLVGAERRGVGIAAYVFCVNIVGYGVAPPLVGMLSDALGTADQPARMAWALATAPAACVVAAVLLAVGAMRRAGDERLA